MEIFYICRQTPTPVSHSLPSNVPCPTELTSMLSQHLIPTSPSRKAQPGECTPWGGAGQPCEDGATRRLQKPKRPGQKWPHLSQGQLPLSSQPSALQPQRPLSWSQPGQTLPRSPHELLLLPLPDPQLPQSLTCRTPTEPSASAWMSSPCGGCP